MALWYNEVVKIIYYKAKIDDIELIKMFFHSATIDSATNQSAIVIGKCW